MRGSVSRKDCFCNPAKSDLFVANAKNDFAETLVGFHAFVSGADGFKREGHGGNSNQDMGEHQEAKKQSGGT